VRLVAAAGEACPGYVTALFDGERELLPILKVMQALVGIRRELAPVFRDLLGPLLRHMPEFS
jgi:hypothetical protein